MSRFIGINSLEEIGLCYRLGQQQLSKTCGALVAFREELVSESLRVDLDPDDLEQSLLKQRLIRKLHTMNTASHYAIVTGIQIHGPNNKNYVWPGEAYTVVDGIRHALSLNQVPEQTTRKSPGAQQPSTRTIL